MTLIEDVLYRWLYQIDKTEKIFNMVLSKLKTKIETIIKIPHKHELAKNELQKSGHLGGEMLR